MGHVKQTPIVSALLHVIHHAKTSEIKTTYQNFHTNFFFALV
jgi:hypothetical protein